MTFYKIVGISTGGMHLNMVYASREQAQHIASTYGFTGSIEEVSR